MCFTSYIWRLILRGYDCAVFFTAEQICKVFYHQLGIQKNTKKAYNDEECNSLVERLLELPEVILKDKNCDIQIMNWNDFYKMLYDFEKTETTLVFILYKI
jgi:hypothetical protein